MSAGLSPGEFLQVFSDELAGWLPHHHVDLMVLTRDGEHFVYLGAAFRDAPYHQPGDDDASLWSGFSEGGRYRLADFTIRHMVESKQALRFDDYPHDPLVAATANPGELWTMREHGLRYGLMLPLMIENNIFGMMCCGRGDPYGRFVDSEFELALMVAARTAPFVHTFRAYLLEHELLAQVASQRDFLGRLNAISRAVAASVDERDILATFASEFRKTIPCEGIEVRLLTSPAGATPICRSFVADRSGNWANVGERPVADELGAHVLLGEETVQIEPAGPGGEGVALSVPLRARSRRIGSLTFTGAAALGSEPTRAAALLFADHLGPYLESVRLGREAEQRGRELGAAGERTRVAEEIHDSIIQDLIAARHLADDRETLDSLLESAISRSRKLLWRLRALEVTAAQLPTLLEAELAATAEELGGVAKAEIDPELEAIDSAQATSLYVIAKQLLTNVRRHSGAGTLALGLTVVGDHCRLVVADDGVGIAPGTIEHQPGADGGGAGLFLIRERVRLGGGELAIRSGAGNGVETEVTLPARRPDHIATGMLAAFAETEPIVVESAAQNSSRYSLRSQSVT